RLESLWLAAMRRDEPGLNIQAMDAFVLARRNHNLQPQDATLAAMTDRLDPAQPLDVRLAAMRAVHACDHRAAADGVMTLLDLTPNPYVTPAVDAVLAAWDHAPARPVWRQRAADAGLPVA